MVMRNVSRCRCPILLVTGAQSVFNGTTRALHQAITKVAEDKAKVEFIEVAEVANVLEEKVRTARGFTTIGNVDFGCL